MIKKTLYFGNPTYLSLQNGQLVIRLPEVEKAKNLPPGFRSDSVVTRPVEDIGVLVRITSRLRLHMGCWRLCWIIIVR